MGHYTAKAFGSYWHPSNALPRGIRVADRPAFDAFSCILLQGMRRHKRQEVLNSNDVRGLIGAPT